MTDRSIQAQTQFLGASQGLELGTPNQRMRVFVQEESDGNFWVAFYRLEGQSWLFCPPHFAPTGFDPPQVRGDPPSLFMRERRLGIDFVFRVDGDEVSFEPVDERVEVVPIDPHVP